MIWPRYSSQSLRKKCPYSELLWSVFFRIRTDNTGKHRPEWLRIQTLFTQCMYSFFFQIFVSKKSLWLLKCLPSFFHLFLKEVREGARPFLHAPFEIRHGNVLASFYTVVKFAHALGDKKGKIRKWFLEVSK